MLLFDQGEFADVAAAWREIENLEALAHDIRRLLKGEGPSPNELEAAVKISDWILVERKVPALVGNVTNHPALQGRRTITTSEIAVGGNGGWVRTASRYYTLGEAFGAQKLSETAT